MPVYCWLNTFILASKEGDISFMFGIEKLFLIILLFLSNNMHMDWVCFVKALISEILPSGVVVWRGEDRVPQFLVLAVWNRRPQFFVFAFLSFH